MTKSAVPSQATGSTSTSKSINTKTPVPHKEVTVPEIHPRVRWHSKLRVELFRNGADILCALLLMIFFFVLGPSIVAMMYPNLIVPFASSLEWKCTKLPTYAELKPSHLALETNLLAPASALNIQLYLKHPNVTLENMEQVLLVIDDCAFDYQADNILLCRPFSNTGYHTSFDDYITMAGTCYKYIRQITRKARIIGFGRGIAANVLLAAAANLRKQSCYQFEKLYLKKPLADIRAEFDKSSWITRTFCLPALRDSLIQDAMEEHGLDKASLKRNVERVGDVPIFIEAANEYDQQYGHLGASVQKITSENLIKELKESVPNHVSKYTSFSFRHTSEEECVNTLHKPTVSVLTL